MGSVKSLSTIRRWIKELKAEECHPNMENYKQGAVMALECILYDWPAPAKFVQVGKKVVVGYGKTRKLVKRERGGGDGN